MRGHSDRWLGRQDKIVDYNCALSSATRFGSREARTWRSNVAEAKLNAIVTSREDLTDSLVIMRITPEGWQLPRFEAGQFAVIGLPAEAPRHSSSTTEATSPRPGSMIRRAYSLTSASHQNEYVEVLIRLVHSGALTPRLWALRGGDRVWLGPRITGMFTLEQIPENVHLVMVATGTGLAPYMSMVRTYLEHHRGRNFTVMHGAQVSADLSFRAELERLQAEFSHFSYIPVLTEPTAEKTPWQGASGLVQDLWRNGIIEKAWGCSPTPATTHVLLCGAPAMIDAMTVLLLSQGFSEHSKTAPGQIHAEHYW